MLNWITENWLALFGAITGTVALLIHFLAYQHSRKKGEINLAVSWAPHTQREENIRTLIETEGSKDWERPAMVEVYTVTVTNLGNISAPLSRVGIVTEKGVERLALVNNGNDLQKTSAENVQPIPPKSEQAFSLYLIRGEEQFEVMKAFAIDQTGKRWEAVLSHKQLKKKA